MEIQSIGPNGINNLLERAQEGGNKTTETFWDTLKESIEQVNSIHENADAALSDLITGKSQNLHQTMIALEKADIAFQLMMQVRNKIVSAYEEIARMQM